MMTEPHGSKPPNNPDPAPDPTPASASTTTPITPSCSSEAEQIAAIQADLDERRRALGYDPYPTVDLLPSDAILESLGLVTPPKPTPDQSAAAAQRRAEADVYAAKVQRRDAYARLCGDRGRRYDGCTWENFQASTASQHKVVHTFQRFKSGFPGAICAGAGIVLFGPRGTGKDHLLFPLLRAATLDHGYNVLWRRGADIFGHFRDVIGNPDETEVDMIGRYVAPDVLAVSDPLPAAGELSVHQANQLYRIVDERYSRKRATWVTVNVKDRADLEARLGSPIVDRLIDGSLVLPCDWPSYRRPWSG